METISDDYMALEEGLKTILSFNLFGTPWQPLFKESSNSPDLTQTRHAESLSVLARIRSNMSSNSHSYEQHFLREIKESYRRRLPARSRQFLIEKEDMLNKISEFHDFEKIGKTIESWGGRLENSRLAFIKAGVNEGYRLSCKSNRGNQSYQVLVLLLDRSGQITKTIISKGII